MFIVYVITIIIVTQLRYIIDVVSSCVILFQSITTIHNGFKIFFEVVQCLTIAIIFELIYYINGYFRVWLTSMNIDPCHAYLLY